MRASTTEREPATIDDFINQKLTSARLVPGPKADALTLIRRATFDLTGLPEKKPKSKSAPEDGTEDEEQPGGPRAGTVAPLPGVKAFVGEEEEDEEILEAV